MGWDGQDRRKQQKNHGAFGRHDADDWQQRGERTKN